MLNVRHNRKNGLALSLSWGVNPVLCEKYDSTDVLFYFAQKTATDLLNLKSGDNIVITGGMVNGLSGNTNLIKVATVE